MQVTTYDDVEVFAARVLPQLAADEAQFNLALAVIGSLRAGQFVPDAPPLLAVVSSGDGDIAVLHTPPHGLLLTGLPSGAAGVVVDTVLAGGWRPPQVVGPSDAVNPVVAEWCARTGATVVGVRRQGIYAVRNLVQPSPVRGDARIAGDADGDLAFAWFSAFSREVGLAPETPRQRTDARVASGDITLWSVDDVPVSMAGIGGRTPRGARIGPVYTPPEHRGHGYGGAATAAVTQRCLDSGAELCFLYTDLANPTSNALYQRLGYEWVTESLEVTFEASPG